MNEQVTDSTPDTPSEATEGTPEPQEQAPGTEAPAEPSGLEKALAAERKARKDAEAELKRLKAEEDKRRLESMSEAERAVAEAKAAGRAEAEAEYQRQLLAARVVGAASAANFHDPSLAMNLISLPSDASDKEINDALSALAAERPYLVKSSPTPPVPQGPRGGSPVSADDWLRQAAVRR